MNALTLSNTGNDRIRPGGNMTPFDESAEEIGALYDEAKNWADGTPVTTDEAEAEVSRLMAMISEAAKRADERRASEVEPLNKAKDEIQSRYNTLIGKTKSITGKAPMALDMLKRIVEPFRIEKQRKAAEEARLAREQAEAAERAAQAAFQHSGVGDLEEREEAERMAQQAKAMSATAKKAEKLATAGTGLVTCWQTVVTDKRAIAAHYWKTRPAEVDAFFLSLAEADVRNGVRVIPGCEITEQKKARL